MVGGMRQTVMKITRLVASALVGTVAVALTACGTATSSDDEGKPGESTSSSHSSSQDPSGSDEESESSQDSDGSDAEATEGIELTLTKTGGIAGINTVVEVAADGGWKIEEGKQAPQSGTLSEDQISQLEEYTGDKDLMVTDRPGGPGKQCDDSYNYILSINGKDMKTDSCGKAPNEPFQNIVDVLHEATGI
jgi:cytoskeletal protein RodZ